MTFKTLSEHLSQQLGFESHDAGINGGWESGGKQFGELGFTIERYNIKDGKIILKEHYYVKLDCEKVSEHIDDAIVLNLNMTMSRRFCSKEVCDFIENLLKIEKI